MKNMILNRSITYLLLSLAGAIINPAKAYTVDQLLGDLQGSSGKIKDLQSANNALNGIGLPPIDINELTVILANPQSLKFVVSGNGTAYDFNTGQVTKTPLAPTYAVVTDRASFTQLQQSLKSTATIQYDAAGNPISQTTINPKIRSVVSDINGDTLAGQNGVPVCITSGGRSTVVTTWNGAIGCMGLAATQQMVSGLNTITQIQTSNFIFNRPTTEFANNIQFMRSMRRYNANGTLNLQPNTKGGSSGADQYSKINENLGLLFSAGGSFGSVDATAGTTGYSLYRRTVTVGTDYRFTDTLTSGLLFNYLSSSNQLNGSAGSFYSDIFRVAPYLSITPFDNAYIDVSVGYGYYDNNTNRNSFINNNFLQGNFHTHEGYGSVNFGYSYPMGAWTLTGYGQGSAIGMYFNGYTEKGTTAAVSGVRVSDNYALSVTTSLGSELNYAWGTPYGVVIPRLFAEWVHEYKNDSQLIASQFLGSGLPALNKTSSPVRNWGNIGLGAQMQFQNAISSYVNFHSLIMDGSNNYTIDGGVRWAF